MRLAQEMIVGGALLLDRVANSHLHRLGVIAESVPNRTLSGIEEGGSLGRVLLEGGKEDLFGRGHLAHGRPQRVFPVQELTRRFTQPNWLRNSRPGCSKKVSM